MVRQIIEFCLNHNQVIMYDLEDKNHVNIQCLSSCIYILQPLVKGSQESREFPKKQFIYIKADHHTNDIKSSQFFIRKTSLNSNLQNSSERDTYQD